MTFLSSCLSLIRWMLEHHVQFQSARPLKGKVLVSPKKVAPGCL